MTKLTNDQEIIKLRLQNELHEEMRADIPDRALRQFMVDDIMSSHTAEDTILRGMEQNVGAIIDELRVTEMGRRVRDIIAHHAEADADAEQSDRDRRLAEIEAEADMAKKQRLNKRLLDDTRAGTV